MSCWCDPDAETANSFSEKAVRLGFIRKVYEIITGHMVVTTAFICLFFYEPNVKLFSMKHPELFWTALALTLVLLIVLACCLNVRRRFPSNVICFVLFTLFESLLLGSVASYFDTEGVMLAVGICAVVCLGITLFAFQAKIDFTCCSGPLLALMITLICFGFIFIFIPNKITMLILASAGAVIFSLYLVFDTLLMMRGCHEYSLSPEEYIFAALNVYIDIIDTFLSICVQKNVNL